MNPSDTALLPTRPADLLPSGGVCLTSWGVISAQGADAAKFLQGQLTNDVEGMDADNARLAGYCSAKGRLLATFIVLRPAPDTFLLLTPIDVLATTLKRLQMFVLRAQCKLHDASAAWALQGLWGDEALAAAQAMMPMQTRDGAVRLADAKVLSADAKPLAVARAMVLTGSDVASANAAATRQIDEATWSWLATASGTPSIGAATTDAFVPQMVNWELLGGVSFRKGCYPGQEVVARSQYRGTLKRRMHLFTANHAVAPGDDVFHASDPTQPAGTVVNAARWPIEAGDQSLALVSLKTAMLDGTAWSTAPTDASPGAALQHLTMPYDVPNEATD